MAAPLLSVAAASTAEDVVLDAKRCRAMQTTAVPVRRLADTESIIVASTQENTVINEVVWSSSGMVAWCELVPCNEYVADPDSDVPDGHPFSASSSHHLIRARSE